MLKLSPDYTLRSVLDMHVIIGISPNSQRNNQILSLNETGAFLWHVLEQGADQATLVRRMCDEYDVSLETAERDVDAFLRQLRSKNLIIED